MRQTPILIGEAVRPDHAIKSDHAMTRDQLNRQLRAHSASFPAVLIVYALILGTMILTGMAMI